MARVREFAWRKHSIWRALRQGGAFFQALESVCTERGAISHITRTVNRPAIIKRVDNKNDFETYLKSATSASTRKKWRAKRRKLEGLGQVAYEQLDTQTQLSNWLDDFYALEMKGWKGEIGTAIGQKSAHRQFIAALTGQALAESRLRFFPFGAGWGRNCDVAGYCIRRYTLCSEDCP